MEDLPSPDDSSEIRLTEELKETMSTSFPSVTGEELRQEAMRAAWNNMADQMIAVVKAIRKNEKRSRRRAIFVYLAIVAGIVTAAITANSVVREVEQANAVTTAAGKKLDEMQERQRATLLAVSALSDALALKMEAEATLDPAVEEEAIAAAQEAQEKALVAKHLAAETTSEKKATEKKLKEVKAKRPLKNKK